jgi:uncharacterized membrane protein
MSFDLQPFWEASLAVQIHVVTALIALFIGIYVFSKRKGTTLHRNMGKVWVVMMALVALSSMFIHQLKVWGSFSPIHLLSIFVLGSLVQAIWMARKGDIVAHKRIMAGLFSGGLILAGLLTFGRDLLMHRIFFANGAGGFIPSPQELPGGAVTFALVGAAVIYIITFFWGGDTKSRKAD